MMERKKSIAALFLKKFKYLFFLVIIGFLGVFLWWILETSPADPTNKKRQLFVIPPKQETNEIIQRLKEEGLIKNPLSFKLLLLKEGLWGELEAGDFQLSPSMSAHDLAFNLTEGRLDVWLVLPEGLRAEEICRKAGEALDKETEFKAEVGLFKKAEGYLFPDSYLVAREAGATEVINLLKENFNNKSLSWQKNFNRKDLSQEEAVILASLVEREARESKDRVKVAEILIKRLANNWPLQVDATLQYIKGEEDNWWPKVGPEDKNLDSPFNTYLNKGLPPAPICNPGIVSLEAVLNAGETSDWFYLSDKDGEMHYAKTLEEQEENIKKYLEP